MAKGKAANIFIIATFTLLYLFVSIISMIHTIAFFQLSNPSEILAISLAVAFELGAAASLATVVTQEAMNKFIVWALFIILTLFQMMGNTYYAYANLEGYVDWVELFNLMELSEIEQKRYLAILSGAILPVVALGYIKCLVDYIKSKNKKEESTEAIDAPRDDEEKENEIIVSTLKSEEVSPRDIETPIEEVHEEIKFPEIVEEPIKHEPVKEEPAKVEEIKPEPAKIEEIKPEPAKVEPKRPEPVKVEAPMHAFKKPVQQVKRTYGPKFVKTDRSSRRQDMKRIGLADIKKVDHFSSKK